MTTVNAIADRTRQAKGNWLGDSSFDAGEASKDALGADRTGVRLSVPARYQILSHIGTGGMGIVYKVRDLETGEIVALKVLKPGIDSDPDMQENLRKEVCLARKVTHKNVCRIHEFNRSHGAACLSMEFVEGETLFSRLRRAGRLSPEDAVSIALQICAGLREAHAQGIVHRDLKPANVMLDASAVVKIMDFGIARLSQTTTQMTGTIAGTPAYMAPEQLELKPMGPWTDIYAVGLLLYEMITGEPAFQGDSTIAVGLKQIRECPRAPREIVPGLPAQIESIVMKCLRKDPSKRFQSIDQLSAALEKERTAKPDAPGWVSFELRVPRLPLQRVVDYGQQKARQAAPQVKVFAAEVRRAGLEASRHTSASFEKACWFLRSEAVQSKLQFNWPAAKMTRNRALAATLGVAMLGTLVTFGLESKGKNQANQAQQALPPASGIVQAAPPVVTLSAVPEAVTASDVTTHEVDLESSVEPESNSTPILSSEPAATPAASPAEAASADAPPAQAAPAAVAPTVKPQAAGSIRSKASQTQHSARSAAHTSPNTVSASSGAPVTNAVVGPPVPIATTDSSAPASAQPAAPVALAAATPAAANSADAAQQKPAGAKSDAPQLFLEVGSFNDASWADKAVEQLSQQGFHAVAIHKSHLWMQSYHVQVGPFQDAAEVEAAQKTLASQNFKSHLVK